MIFICIHTHTDARNKRAGNKDPFAKKLKTKRHTKKEIK